MSVEVLGYSLIGLAIPIVTFTNQETDNKNKNVILVSSRIHPGETCGSYVASGVLNRLAENSDEINSFL